MKALTIKLLATFFGVGLIPFAPGTFASIATFMIFFLCQYYSPIILYHSPFFFGIFLLLMTGFFGYYATKFYIEELDDHDPKEVVIDEVLGLSVAFVLYLLITSYYFVSTMDPFLMILGLIVFRLADIFKWWPANIYDQHYHNAFGVMMDDVFAGLYSGMTMIIAHMWYFNYV